MRKLLFVILCISSFSVYSQVAYVAGAKVNQPFDTFIKTIDTSKETYQNITK